MLYIFKKLKDDAALYSFFFFFEKRNEKKPGGPNINIFKTFVTLLFPADDFFFKFIIYWARILTWARVILIF